MWSGNSHSVFRLPKREESTDCSWKLLFDVDTYAVYQKAIILTAIQSNKRIPDICFIENTTPVFQEQMRLLNTFNIICVCDMECTNPVGRYYEQERPTVVALMKNIETGDHYLVLPQHGMDWNDIWSRIKQRLTIMTECLTDARSRYHVSHILPMDTATHIAGYTRLETAIFYPNTFRQTYDHLCQRQDWTSAIGTVRLEPSDENQRVEPEWVKRYPRGITANRTTPCTDKWARFTNIHTVYVKTAAIREMLGNPALENEKSLSVCVIVGSRTRVCFCLC